MAADRTLNPDDLYSLTFVSDPQISPDGKQIAYVQTTINQETKEYNSTIWVVASGGSGKPRSFTSGMKADTSPRWSPDGSRLAFVSDRGGDKQIWVMPTNGGEALQLTKMRRGASSPVWSPGGDKICFAAPIFAEDNPEDYEKPLDSKDKEKENKDRLNQPAIMTRIRTKSDSAMGLLPESRTHIFVKHICKNEPAKQITTGDFDHFGHTWSPDGKQIAFSANRQKDPDVDPWLVDIFTTSSEGGELRQLTDTQGPSGSPIWTPDGQWIVYAGHKREYGSATLSKVWKIPVEGGPAILLTDFFDRSVGDSMAGDSRFGPSSNGPAISRNGKDIFFLASDLGNTSLFSVSIEGGPVKTVLGGEKHIYGFTVDNSGETFATAVSYPTLPGDIGVFHLGAGQENLLTQINQKLLDSVHLSQPESVEYLSSDNQSRLGWIMKPANYVEGQKYPAVLEIHGGPASMYGWTFFFEFQLLCAEGYAVFYTNPRGGQGFGQEFLKAVIGDYGGMDYQDLMAWTDTVCRQEFVDKDNLGVTGGSYGGFMTNWIVGHTDRFKAAVTQRSISNWLSFFGVSDIGYTFTETQICGLPWKDKDLLWERSPLAYVENVVTSVLIIHAEKDIRCPIEQGEQFYTALKKLGKEVEMARFPESNHELSRRGKPLLRVHRLKQILRWFDAHLNKNTETKED